MDRRSVVFREERASCVASSMRMIPFRHNRIRPELSIQQKTMISLERSALFGVEAFRALSTMLAAAIVERVFVIRERGFRSMSREISRTSGIFLNDARLRNDDTGERR